MQDTSRQRHTAMQRHGDTDLSQCRRARLRASPGPPPLFDLGCHSRCRWQTNHHPRSSQGERYTEATEARRPRPMGRQATQAVALSYLDERVLHDGLLQLAVPVHGLQRAGMKRPARGTGRAVKSTVRPWAFQSTDRGCWLAPIEIVVRGRGLRNKARGYPFFCASACSGYRDAIAPQVLRFHRIGFGLAACTLLPLPCMQWRWVNPEEALPQSFPTSRPRSLSPNGPCLSHRFGA